MAKIGTEDAPITVEPDEPVQAPTEPTPAPETVPATQPAPEPARR